MIAYDGNSGKQGGEGWSLWSVLVAVLGALGGILVALSVKHTDSIMKSIAVSGAIVVAGLGGYLFLDGPMTLAMVIGSVVAIVATQNYTLDPDAKVEAPDALPLLRQGGRSKDSDDAHESA